MSFPSLDTLIKEPPFNLDKDDKNRLLRAAMAEVTAFHFANCTPYQKICTARNFDPESAWGLQDLPYLATALFKDALLLSVPEDQVFRQISSSATTSGRASRIGLDKETSRRQSKCFNKVVFDRMGTDRRKFIVLDEPSVIKKTSKVSARASTIRSLLFCASEAVPCLIDNGGQLSLDVDKLVGELRAAEESGEEIVIFGFTYILPGSPLQRGLRQDLLHEPQ